MRYSFAQTRFRLCYSPTNSFMMLLNLIDNKTVMYKYWIGMDDASFDVSYMISYLHSCKSSNSFA